MRHPADRPRDCRAVRQPSPKGTGLLDVNPEPPHPRIDLQPHTHPIRQGHAFEQVDLERMVDDEVQAQVRRQLQVLGIEDAFQDRDGRAYSTGPELQRLIEARHGQGIGMRREGMRHRQQAVAVGVGLDHGHDARVRRMAAHNRKVMGKRREIDLDPRGAAPRRLHA